MSKEIGNIREVIRRELDTVALIPVSLGVQQVAAKSPSTAYALYCEAVYVRLFNGRDFYDIMQYLEHNMRLGPEAARKVVTMAIHVRDVLAYYQGDCRLALTDLEHERGSDKPVLREVLDTALRVSQEYNVGWERLFGTGSEAAERRRKRLQKRILTMSAAALLVIVLAVAVWLSMRMLTTQ